MPLDDNKENRFAAELDEYGSDTMSEINIVGRIILNIWRMMRNEVMFKSSLLTHLFVLVHLFRSVCYSVRIDIVYH